MTVKEMLVYVDVGIERIEKSNKDISKKNILDELNFLTYHCNKKRILFVRNITGEKYLKNTKL